ALVDLDMLTQFGDMLTPVQLEPATQLLFAGSDATLFGFDYSTFNTYDVAKRTPIDHMELPLSVISAASGPEGVLAAGTVPQVVVTAYDPATGSERWSTAFSGNLSEAVSLSLD